MAHDLTSRRDAAMLIAAALMPSCAARASGISHIELRTGPSASMLPPPASEVYVPPSSLTMVADLYRRMTVSVRIAGAGPFPCVVDTGANQSVLSCELVAQLGLPLGPSQPLNGVAGIQITPTTVARLEIGKRDLPAAVMSVLPAADIGAPGLLGLDSLGDQALTIDFAERSLRIETRHNYWRDPDAIAMKARRRDGQLTLVDADLAGVPLVTFLDSGAQSTIGNMALRRHAASRNLAAVWLETPIVSSTGQSIMAEMANLPGLRVGGLKVPNWPVAFADLHTFQMWNLIDTPAILLGVDILSRFQYVCLDFARGEVRFRLPTA